MTQVDEQFRLPESVLNDPNLYYDIQANNVGYCLIFNNSEFHPSLNKKERKGSSVDVTSVRRAFGRIGFEVVPYNNLTTTELKKECQKYSTKPELRDHGCIAVVLLSHGEDDGIFSNDGHVAIDTIVSYFKNDRCPLLKGKPKLFFIQACRGTTMDKGVKLGTDAIGARIMTIRKIPVESDILMHYSTVPGYLAWRNEERGSWFIENLCYVLQTYGESNADLVDLLTVVNRRVAYLCHTNTLKKDTDDMKQMPSVVNQLTRRVRLPNMRR